MMKNELYMKFFIECTYQEVNETWLEKSMKVKRIQESIYIFGYLLELNMESGK